MLSLGVTLLAAVGIIVIGGMYIFNPLGAMKSFGLPLPEEGPNIACCLRLKGVRDIVAGLVVLAMMVWAGPRITGIVLLIESLIPIGDMSIILAARGSAMKAFGIHGVTAALMILAASSLVAGHV